MKLNALLRYGIASLLLVLVVLPLAAWRKSDAEEVRKPAAAAIELLEEAADVPGDLTPDMLVATYVGSSGCTATGHKFEVGIEALDPENAMFSVRNLLDEGQSIKAKLREGQLSLGKQKMGSFTVTGSIKYLQSPARIVTMIKFDDGVGYCEEESVFMKR